MPRLACSLIAAFGLLLVTSPAAAQQLSFTATGGFSAFWTLPQNPTPDVDFGDAFRLTDISLLYNGSQLTADLEFYDAGAGGGTCGDVDCVLFDLRGDELYTGPSSAPLFVVGTYELFDLVTASEVTLDIARVAVGVPEPATALLLGVGLGGLAVVARRRRAGMAQG